MDDKIVTYKQAIRRTILEIEALDARQGPDDIQTVAVIDDERGRYLLQNVGWSGSHREDTSVVFIRIQDGRVWLEEDWTDLRVADRLIAAGIPKSDIVLGFHPPKERQYTEFAVA
jgi:hypothetical protein